MEGLGNIRVGRRAPSLLFLTLDFPHLLSAQSARIQRGTLWGRKACLLAPLEPAILSPSSVSPSGGLLLLLHLPASSTGPGAPWGLGRSVYAPHVHLAPASAERWLGTNRGVWGLGVGVLMQALGG